MKQNKMTILDEDLCYTFNQLTEQEKAKFSGSVILITGCGGFLGSYHMSFFEKFANELNISKIIGIDTFLLGQSPVLDKIKNNPLVEIVKMDVCDFPQSQLAKEYEIDYVLHMASIASPTYYRKYPVETIESNVWGIKVLLDYFKDKKLKGFLFYSSSEIYGDPDQEHIPSDESYNGNVACLGPRACYDESKRFGETLCWIYHKQFNLPVRIVRLFNVYGPCLNINDKRAPADFAKAVVDNDPIPVFSDGKTTRSFCYVADSCAGELKAMLYKDFDVFNIGNNSEISIEDCAKCYESAGKEIFGYNNQLIFTKSSDPDYLTDDPQRRLPCIDKSSSLLGFRGTIDLREGIKRYLCHIKEIGEQAAW